MVRKKRPAPPPPTVIDTRPAPPSPPLNNNRTNLIQTNLSSSDEPFFSAIFKIAKYTNFVLYLRFYNQNFQTLIFYSRCINHITKYHSVFMNYVVKLNNFYFSINTDMSRQICTDLVSPIGTKLHNCII